MDKKETGSRIITDPRIVRMFLHAWVGEDELGSGQVGLKQTLTPAGYIPMVSCMENRMEQDYITKAMTFQAKTFLKTIRLVKFRFEEVEVEISTKGIVQRFTRKQQ